MPRIYNSASEPIDFCKRCMPKEHEALKRYGNEARTGSGPDERGNCFGYDAEHPEYSDTDYRCHTCHKHLTDADN